MTLAARLDFALDSELPPPPPLTLAATSRQRLADLLAPFRGRFRVGIVWSGNPAFSSNNLRATTLERFLSLAEVPGVQLISLQKGPPEQELDQPGLAPLVFDLGRKLNHFGETAAACELLDLVIMTDSSVAHLAGSLGRPVWNLLRYAPYWVYGVSGAKTSWYPSMTLFRQPKPGDWESVFTQVRSALTQAVRLHYSARKVAAVS